MKEQERYKNHDKRTQERIAECLATLHKIHGKDLSDSYWVALDLMADSFDIYFTALDSIKTTGVIGNEKFKSKNPALPCMAQQQLYINRLLNNLGLTPMALNKMKKGADAMPSDLDEFLD